MFKLSTTLTSAAIAVYILTVGQIDAAPLQARDGDHKSDFVLAQYKSGDKKWFTSPHGAVRHENIVRIQEEFDLNAVPLKIKPYKGDDGIELSLVWQEGFKGASLDDGTRGKTASKTLIAKTEDGKISCMFPFEDDPEDADYVRKMRCMDTKDLPSVREVVSVGVQLVAGVALE